MIVTTTASMPRCQPAMQQTAETTMAKASSGFSIGKGIVTAIANQKSVK